MNSGFSAIAKNLAVSVSGLLGTGSAGGSFVVGLEGKWGSGKSTILNYLRAELTPLLDHTRQFIVEFDPWWLEEGANIATALGKNAQAMSRRGGYARPQEKVRGVVRSYQCPCVVQSSSAGV